MSYGINQIQLFENDTSLSYKYVGDGSIGEVVHTGTQFTFDTCHNPGYVKTLIRQEGKKVYERNVNFELRTRSEFTNMRTILRSWYGWIVIVTLYDRTQRIFTDPLFLQETKESFSDGVNYQITLKHYTNSTNEDTIYNLSDFLTVDQTDITVDQTDITVDQITI